MNTITITSCICQECSHHFKTEKDIITVIDTDNDLDILPLLLNYKLNLITCPSCNKTFTYETQMLIYSESKSYAIKVNPKNFVIQNKDPLNSLSFLTSDNFKYREVTFLIEAIEKILIFNDDYSDIDIEYLKHSVFKDNISGPIDKYNIIYSHTYNNKLCFLRLNSLNEILSGYIINSYFNTPYNIKNEFIQNNIWQFINQKTIKECNLWKIIKMPW